MFFDEPKYYVIASIVAVICLVFIVLYMQYQKKKAEQNIQQENALIDEGQVRLDREYFIADGTLNPMPYVFTETGVPSAEESVINGTDGIAEQQDEAGEPTTKKKGVMKQMVDYMKSGKLLKTINQFAVRTNSLTDRVASKQQQGTEEEKTEKEKYGRLADDAVNPLFAMRFAKIKKKQHEQQHRRALNDERNAAATAMMQQQFASSQNDENKPDAEQSTRSSGIYQFNASELAQLEKVMSAQNKETTAAAQKDELRDEQVKTISDRQGTKRDEYLGESGVDGAVQGAFQTEQTRKK